MRSAARPSNDGLQATRLGFACIGKKLVGHTVGGYHFGLMRHAELRKDVYRVPHGLPVTA